MSSCQPDSVNSLHMWKEILANVNFVGQTPENNFFLLWRVYSLKYLFLKKIYKKNNGNSGFYISLFSHLLWDLLSFNSDIFSSYN